MSVRGGAPCGRVLSRAALFGGVLAMALGCGGPPRGGGGPAPGSTGGGEAVARAGDAHVMVISRPTAGYVLLQLWIDAGARDAGPEVATLASLVAAARADAGAGDADDAVRARVVPDGTSFELVARAGALEAAMARLGRALAAREPSQDELGAAREELRRRRRARAADVLGDAERLALAALAGEESAARLDPLAHAEEPPAREEVAAFLAAHYGPARALLVGVGDVEVDALGRALEAATREAPAALEVAPLRADWVAAGHDRALAEEDASEAAFAVALRVPTPAAAEHVAASLLVRLGPGARAAALPVPPGVLVLGAAPGALEPELAGAIVRTARAVHVGAEPAVTALSAAALADAAGLAWAARPERGEVHDASDTLAVALGVLGEGAAARALEVAPALALEAAPVDGELEVLVREVPGDVVALSVALLGGASEDPASGHGRAAIVARAVATRCGGDVLAWAEPRSIGLLRASGRALAPDALAALVECALFSRIEPGDLERARRDALAALGDGEAFRARAALALVPGAPGLVAPLGSPDGIAGAADLAAWLDEQRTAARARLGMTASIAWSGIAHGLRAGGAPIPRAPAPAAGDVFVADESVEIPEVLVALRTEREAPRFVARLAASALSRAASAGALSVVHADGDVAPGLSWLAIGLRGPSDARDEIPTRLEAWLATARADALERLEAQWDDDRAERALAFADVALVARDAALEDGEPAADLDACRAALDALLSGPPHFVIVRPAPASLRRR